MPQTLKNLVLEDAAVGGVFLPTDDDGNPTDFNELVEFYPEGDPGRRVQTHAVVFEDNLEGTREVRGDGVVSNDRDGRRTRESAIFEVPQSLDVRVRQKAQRPDQFRDASGELWKVVRIEGRDSWEQTAGIQSVLCVRVKDGTLRNEGRTG